MKFLILDLENAGCASVDQKKRMICYSTTN